MNLSESQKSEDSSGSWVKFDNTSNSDDKGEFGFSWDEDLSSQLSLSSGVDFSSLRGLIFSLEFLGSFGDLLSSNFIGGSSLYSLLLKSCCDFLISLLFFSKSFWFRNNLLFSCHYHKNKLIIKN